MLEFGMSKTEVLEQIYPDEVAFMLDAAEERKTRIFREITLAVQADPEKNLSRLGARVARSQEPEVEATDLDREKGAMQLAAWAGNTNLMRRIQLYKRANELREAEKNG